MYVEAYVFPRYKYLKKHYYAFTLHTKQYKIWIEWTHLYNHRWLTEYSFL